MTISDAVSGTPSGTDFPPRIADLPLDDLRLALAPAVADAAAFDGWSDAAIVTAAAAAHVPAELAMLAFDTTPHGKAMAMIAAWIAHIDTAMADALPAATLAALPVRERIRRLVSFRLTVMTGREEALRRALAIMATPAHAPRAVRLGWHSADVMWRLAGDTAADFNHYTKRMTLAALYATTLAVFVDDTSNDKAETRAFLDRRIDGVLRFEKAKARLLRRPGINTHFSMARFLGRLRYPAQ